MKNRNFDAFPLIGALFIVSLIITSCKSGDESLGLSLMPGNTEIYTRNFTESESIRSFTYTDEKIRVDHPGLNYIGSFNDPLFGRTDGGFAAQYRISSNPDYDKTSTLDSIILRLTYKRIYGDTATRQTLKVYELTSDMDYDAKYLSSFDLKSLASPKVIGNASFIPKFKTDSTLKDTTTQYIHFRLDPALGNRLLKMDSLNMISNEEFLKHFKGLYVESATAERKGTLVGLSPTGSAIGIYYHSATKDTLFFSYNVTSNSANVAAFYHNYSASLFGSHLNQELIQDSLTYLQPTGGTKVKINIPSLSKWRDSTNFIISRAYISIYVDTLVSDPRRYGIPSSLYLKYIDGTGAEVFPKDSELSSAYYGGRYDPSTASYSFNITRHLEQIINNEIVSTSLYLVHPDRKGSPSRVVLKSGNSSRPIMLNVKYSRVK